MEKKLTLFIILLLFSSSVNSATIKKGEYFGYESLILENEYIKATIIPDSNGRIAEYIYKPIGSNYFLPYQEQRISTNPLLELARAVVAETNFGGYEDWCWETGLQKSKIKYEAKVLKKEGREVAVALIPPGEKGGVRLERTVSLKDKSTELKIEISINNQSESSYSYWMHSMVQVGGDFKYDDYIIFPLRKTSRRFLNNKTEIVPEESLLVKKRVREEPNLFYLPSQPWWALIDKKKRLIVGQVISPTLLTKERTVLYSNCGESWDSSGPVMVQIPAMTQEIIFPIVKPEEERTFTISLVTISGMDNLSYLNREMGISVEQKEGYFQAKLSPTKEIKDITLILFLSSPQKKYQIKKLFLSELRPGKILEKKIILPDNLSPGEYLLIGELITSSGKDEFKIIGCKLVADMIN